MPLFALFSDLGLINTAQAVILPPLAGAFGVFLLRQFFLRIPSSWRNQLSLTDAANWGTSPRYPSPFQAWLVCIIHLYSPGLLEQLSLAPHCTAGPDKDDPSRRPRHTAGTYATSSYGVLMAAAVISSVPIFVMFVFMKKYFIQGIALTGGMK